MIKWWSLLVIVIIATLAKSYEIKDICMTRICNEESKRVSAMMDKEVDPCDDFYEFACGNFLKKTVIPDDKRRVETAGIVEDLLRDNLRASLSEPIKWYEKAPIQNTKKLYKACMNEDLTEERGTAPIMDKLNAMGGWPVAIGDNWDENSWTWQQAIAESGRNGFSVSYFIAIYVETDALDTTKHSVLIDKADLLLSRDYLLKQMNESLVEAYHSYQVDLAVMFGAERSRAEVEMREVLEFEFELAAISASTSGYNTIKVSDLQRYYNYNKWLPYLNSILPQEAQLTKNDVIVFCDPPFFNDLGDLLANTPKRTLANYVKWRQAFLAVRFMPKEFKKRMQIYTEAITGKTSQDPRWLQCVLTVSKYYPVAVGALYIQKYFGLYEKKIALEMVNNIKAEFIVILKETDWIDDKTRAEAIKKATMITERIGFADELLDYAKVEEFYAKTPANVSEFEYFESVLNLKAAEAYGKFKMLREPVDDKDWTKDMPPATVNAGYSRTKNSINFPAGILQDVYFNARRPQYMNYGGIGFIIGHEITHGFDDNGSKYDGRGNAKNWWKAKTRLAFLKKVKCFVEQYGNFTEPLTNLKIDGVYTQGENIADNGGIKQAYHAYVRWSQNNTELMLPGLSYSPYQMFWITAAQGWCDVSREGAMKSQIANDKHAPSQFRIIGMLRNRKEFAKDFQCQLGKKMNPRNKCEVW